MTLKEVSIGQTVTVKKLSGQGATKRRIMDMGITKGVTVTVQKVAPLGDPIELTVRPGLVVGAFLFSQRVVNRGSS